MLIETDITVMTDTTGIINSVVSLSLYFNCTCSGILYSQDRCEEVLTMEKARRLGRNFARNLDIACGEYSYAIPL